MTPTEPTEEAIAHQLAPFHEFECTGQNDEFVQTIEITEKYETVEDYIDDYGDNRVETDLDVREFIGSDLYTNDHKYNFLLERSDGSFQVYDRTNPDSRWDWWVVGGRWKNRLMDRDSVSIEELLRNEGALLYRARSDARALLDKHKTAYVEYLYSQSTEDNEAIITRQVDRIRNISFEEEKQVWESYKAAGGVETIYTQFLRTEEGFRSAKEAVASLNQENPIYKGYYLGMHSLYYPVSLQESWDDVFENCVLFPVRALVTLDRTWLERGEMGWFGMSNDHMTANEFFYKVVLQTLYDAPEGAWLTLVDCHI